MTDKGTSEARAEAATEVPLDMPIIARRRIEAEILKHVYDVLRESHGEEAARAAIGAAVSRSAIQQGERFRAALGRDPGFEDFAAIMPNWTANDSLRIDIKAQDAERLDFDVTRCRYAEMYRQMGLGEIGHLLSCNRDGDFCVGYNPKMQLTRTHTIMQGAKSCDFRYRMKDEEKS
jgi:hypothetical protein